MAAIGKIRQHYGILVVIIGVALLAFVLGDLLKSDFWKSEPNVAVVDGEKIKSRDFIKEVEGSLRNTRFPVSEMETEYKIYFLDNMIREKLMKKELEALNIQVTDEELKDMFTGKEIRSEIQQIPVFFNENNEFDRAKYDEFLSNFDQLDEQYQTWWVNVEDELAEIRTEEKYSNLIKQSFYLPKKLADKYNENRNLKRSAEVYVVKYNTISDSMIEITEQDKKNYFEENKEKYAYTDETRTIDYVVFDIKPTDHDREIAKAEMLSIKDKFEATENVKLFLSFSDNSITKFDTTWRKATDFANLTDMISTHEVGYVCEPYQDNDTYKMARIMGKELRNDTLWAQMAIATHRVSISTETANDVNAIVEKYISENNSADAFRNAINESNYSMRVDYLTKQSLGVSGIPSTRGIVTWAFKDDVKTNDKPELFTYNDKYIVAILKDIKQKGDYPDYEEFVSARANFDIIKKTKKIQKIAEMAKQYGDNYDAMIEALHGEKLVVDDITFDANGFKGMTGEEKISGTALGIKEGVWSAPILGGNAYAVLKVTGTTPAGETNFSAMNAAAKSKFINNMVTPYPYRTYRQYQISRQYPGYYRGILENAEVERNETSAF